MSDGVVSLGGPPPFGSRGELPPIQGSPQVVARSEFVVVDNNFIRSDAAAGAATFSVAAAIHPLGFLIPLVAAAAERLRGQEPPKPNRTVTHTQRWRRQDPVLELPPGAEWTRELSISTEITRTQTRELSRSLGLKAGFGGAALSGELTRKFGISVQLREQHRETETLRLPNPSESLYRLYAIWTVVNNISVRKISEDPILYDLEFVLPGAPVTRHYDLHRDATN